MVDTLIRRLRQAQGGLKVPGTTGGVSVVWLTAVDVARGCDCGAGVGKICILVLGRENHL